jgi:hypothetical protein
MSFIAPAQTHRGPEGRPLNVSPARKGWVRIPIMIPPAPLRPGVPWGPPWERHRRGTHLAFSHADLSLSFRHRNRHCLAGAAFGDPDRVARGLDCGWCLESFLDYRDAGLITIDSNNRNLAAAVLSNE